MRQSHPADKNMVVEFSHLNDNNKTEFLEFLLMNNITFEKTCQNGKNDYVAKVTVPKPTIYKPSNQKNKENVCNSRSANKTKTNGNIKSERRT